MNFDATGLSREQARAVDRIAIDRFGLSGIVMMENAGRNCADQLFRMGIDGAVKILCGAGNNGGDGFVIARHLDNRMVPVEVLLAGSPDKLPADAAENHRIWQKMNGPLQHFDDLSGEDDLVQWLAATADYQTAWIVDCLLGTGARGPLRAPFDQIVRAANRSPAKRLAVDIPTGLDCDTGLAESEPFRADETFTFVELKRGMLEAAAAAVCGSIRVIPIGVPRAAIEAACRI